MHIYIYIYLFIYILGTCKEDNTLCSDKVWQNGEKGCALLAETLHKIAPQSIVLVAHCPICVKRRSLDAGASKLIGRSEGKCAGQWKCGIRCGKTNINKQEITMKLTNNEITHKHIETNVG